MHSFSFFFHLNSWILQGSRASECYPTSATELVSPFAVNVAINGIHLEHFVSRREICHASIMYMYCIWNISETEATGIPVSTVPVAIVGITCSQKYPSSHTPITQMIYLLLFAEFLVLWWLQNGSRKHSQVVRQRADKNVTLIIEFKELSVPQRGGWPQLNAFSMGAKLEHTQASLSLTWRNLGSMMSFSLSV